MMGGTITRTIPGSNLVAGWRGWTILTLVAMLAGSLGCSSLPGISRTGCMSVAPSEPAVHADPVVADMEGKVASPTEPAVGLAVDTPAIPSPSDPYAINLATALELAGANNPTIALAREAVQEAL